MHVSQSLYILSGLLLTTSAQTVGFRPVPKPPDFSSDVEFSAETVKQFADSMRLKRSGSLRLTVRDVDKLIEGPSPMFRSAQINYNSTDEILDNFDKQIINNSRYTESEVIMQKNVIVQTFNIITTNIAGIAVYENEGAITSKPVYRNSSLASVLAGGSFLVGAYIPHALLEQLEDEMGHAIAITVFFKDPLFAETTSVTHRTSGIAFGVLIPGFEGVFRTPLKLAFKVDEEDIAERGCAHWLYGSYIKGSWKQDTTSAVCGAIEICEYYHVTHFGMLVLDSTNSIKQHQTALDVITIVGCSLSVFGVFGIALTAALFEKWRQNKGNVILLNYAFATLFEILLLYISDYIKDVSVCDDRGCFWSGLLLHYLVLAQFFWVLVISYLQYKRYVQIFGAPTTRLLLKSCLIGWCGPLPIVGVLGVFFHNSYSRNDSNLCYPTGLALYLGVLFPILIIVIVNLAVFGLITASIFKTNDREVPRLTDNLTVLKLRLLLLLFFQLGLTWIFGIFSNLSIVFVYLFCITATIQGFVVFLLFIVFNGTTNQMYMKLLGCKDKKTVTRTEATSSSRVT